MGVNLRGAATPNPRPSGGILQQIFDGISGIGEALAEGLEGIISGLIDMVLGRYEGNYPAFVDGQAALNERFDLLGTSGYFPATMGSNFRLGPGRNRALPFDTRIGPNNGAELVQVNRTHPGEGSAVRTEWAIRLDRKGLWQANSNFKHLGDPMFGSYGEIVVLRPDLTVYSVTQLPSAQPDNTGNNSMGGASLSLFKMFVIPEPGYYVQVRWYWNEWFGIRTVQGGSILSQFAVTQWSDEIDGNEHQNPDGDITDPGGSEPPTP